MHGDHLHWFSSHRSRVWATPITERQSSIVQWLSAIKGCLASHSSWNSVQHLDQGLPRVAQLLELCMCSTWIKSWLVWHSSWNSVQHLESRADSCAAALGTSCSNWNQELPRVLQLLELLCSTWGDSMPCCRYCSCSDHGYVFWNMEHSWVM